MLRRVAVAGFPRWSFAITQLIVGLIATAAVREPWLGLGAGGRAMRSRAYLAVAGMAVAAAAAAARWAAL